MSNESHGSNEELHSTPRNHTSHPNLPVSIDQYVVLSQPPSTIEETDSPPPESIHSIESEADVIERTIKNSNRVNVDLTELSSNLSTTSVFSAPIMHSSEVNTFNPSGVQTVDPAKHYFGRLDSQIETHFLPSQQSQSAPAPPPPTVPISPPPCPSIPLMDMSQVPLHSVSSLQGRGSSQSRGVSHLGRRAFVSPTPPNILPTKPSNPPVGPVSSASIMNPVLVPTAPNPADNTSCRSVSPPTNDTTNHSHQDIKNISPIPPSITSQPPAHWYYSNPDGSWTPFSFLDSLNLEEIHYQRIKDPLNTRDIVRTDGGRFDVNLSARQRIPIYWEGISSAIRRCTWFYRGNNEIMQPYNEDIAALLEEHYCSAVRKRTFPVRVEFGTEVVLINSSTVIVQYSIHSSEQDKASPKLVKRGVPDIEKIPQDEHLKVDHLIFVVHGIGPGGDLKFRSFVDCVNDMRRTTQSLVSEHWEKLAPPPGSVGTSSSEPSVEEVIKKPIVPLDLHDIPVEEVIKRPIVPLDLHDILRTPPAKEKPKEEIPYSVPDTAPTGRIEFLPIQWHAALHTDTLGVDRHLANITLPSISKLRDFVNSTCVDVLFYTSPYYCQAIVHQCGDEMNRLYRLFLSRNNEFTGDVSICGHSLGSVIAFDILSNQEGGSCPLRTSSCEDFTNDVERRHSTPTYDETQFVKDGDTSGTGQPHVTPIPLLFKPKHLFTMGSPLGLFLTVRGVHRLGSNFSLPTCPHLYNIFHPYDPVAYRLEPLIDGQSGGPVILPHHKGRKRMHKEITEQLTRVGVAMKKQITNTFSSFYSTAPEETETDKQAEVAQPPERHFGELNQGSYIDYMLQESPLEIVNEYLFSLSSHVCYWTSEDTVFLMIREVFKHETSTPPHLPLL